MERHSLKSKNRPGKILVVDDSLTIRMQVKELLEEGGFDVRLAEDGSKCLDALQKDLPDVVLLDIIMPELNGIEVCRYIKAENRLHNIPILILTSVTDVENKVKGLNAGADDYITKPFEVSELLARLKVLIRNKELQDELRLANQKILEQQKAVIEEERLKLLLQIAGATAHELNQPLMILLGNIELMRLNMHDSTKLEHSLAAVEEAGQRIADIIQKIRTIRHDEVKPYLGDSAIVNFDQEIKILAVEDDALFFTSLKDMLAQQTSIHLFHVSTVKEAKSLFLKEIYDLALLDYHLPDGDAFDLLHFIKEHAIQVPSIMLTGQGNEVAASQAIQAGAYDYLPKENINYASLNRSITNALEKSRLHNEVNLAMEKMTQISIRDELTGLYNRGHMDDMLQREVVRAHRYGTDLACLLIDLDFFKNVNDEFGHACGDDVLRQFGECLAANTRDTDICSRYGGEAFMVLLPSSDFQGALNTAEKIRRHCENMASNDGIRDVKVTVSIGTAMLQSHPPMQAENLLTHAEKALYQAKALGRNRVEAATRLPGDLPSEKKKQTGKDIAGKVSVSA